MNDEINLRDYLDIAMKRWTVIAALAVCMALLALGYSVMQRPVYEARTTILVRSSGSGSSLSQFAGLAGLAGVNLSSGRENVKELAEILQSKTIAGKVIDDLELNKRIAGWNNPSLSRQRKVFRLQKMLGKPERHGDFIELKVSCTDPMLAAEIADGFVNALSFYWNKLNYSEAQKKRDYIESQLPRVEKELESAEHKLKKFTLLSPRGAASSSSLLGTIAGSQSQGIEIARLTRELDIQNSVYTMLRKEYESVKLEESKEIPPFAIVDQAEVPEKPFKPRKKLNTLVGLILGLGSGTFLAFFLEYWEKTGG